MDGLPLLMMPMPGMPADRAKLGRGGGAVRGPGAKRQVERLGPAWKQLEESFERRRNQLRSDATGLEPEEVVVLECLGTIGDFLNAVIRVPGVEWLGEWDAERVDPDEDFYQIKPGRKGGPPKEDRTSPILRRLFLVFTNQQALGEMLSMWKAWSSGKKLDRGLGRWRSVFEQLRDVRRWSVQDRLAETGLLDDWRERATEGQEAGIAEIELWFHSNPARRRVAEQTVSESVRACGGDVLVRADIEEAAYHALLVRMPLGALLSVQELDEVAFLQSEDIQFARPVGQCPEPSPEGDPQEVSVQTYPQLPSGAPVAALLDGMPMQNHPILAGRLVIDDPDDYGAEYPVGARKHGTSMASLIVAGDLNGPRAPIGTPLYVRPIMTTKSSFVGTQERVPEGMLFPDLLLRAVRRIKEGEAGRAATAPDVSVVNLSIGERGRPFFGTMSATARVLDWLSWRYGMLFLVSAGNCTGSVQIEASGGRLAALKANDLEDRILQARFDDRRNRRLLAPAESVNAVTVGALHEDLSTSPPFNPSWWDPCTAAQQPSLLNPIAGGYGRSLKPDLLVPGGRQLLEESPVPDGDRVTLELVRSIGPPGALVACPPSGALQAAGAQVYSRGTSNATAIATREAIRLLELLERLRAEPGGEILDEIPRGLWLKTLLVHGADWGEAPATLRRALGQERLRSGTSDRVGLGRFLGYGAYSAERSSLCTSWRATALGAGRLDANQSHVHRVPVPAALGARGKRRLTITLAWFTPIRPRVHEYALADLWYRVSHLAGMDLARQQADDKAALRGTVQHEIFEGEKTVVIEPRQELEIQVSCREVGGKLPGPVPYGLAVTLEAAEGVSIYQEVRERLRQRVVVRPAGV